MSFLILNLNKTDQKRFRKLGRAAFPQNHLSGVSESPFYPQNGVSDDSETSFCPHFTCPTCRTVHFMFISSFPTSRTPHLTLISPIRRVGNPISCSFHQSDVSETIIPPPLRGSILWGFACPGGCANPVGFAYRLHPRLCSGHRSAVSFKIQKSKFKIPFLLGFACPQNILRTRSTAAMKVSISALVL